MQWWAAHDEILQPATTLDLSYNHLSRPHIGIVVQHPTIAKRGMGFSFMVVCTTIRGVREIESSRCEIGIIKFVEISQAFDCQFTKQ